MFTKAILEIPHLYSQVQVEMSQGHYSKHLTIMYLSRLLEQLETDQRQMQQQYKVNTAIKIPPFAHLVGEGPDKTIIYQAGGNGPVAVTEDNGGQTFGNIGDSSATTPTQIQIEGITFKNA